MKRHITDGEKHDLAMVVCDKLACLGRSEFGRCYENDFVRCPYYLLAPHKYSKADVDTYREIKSMGRNI